MTTEELVKEILSAAKKNGLYRQQIIDEFSGLIPKRDIARAITLARRQGMYSVAEMRHMQLGTYYQYDGDV